MNGQWLMPGTKISTIRLIISEIKGRRGEERRGEERRGEESRVY